MVRHPVALVLALTAIAALPVSSGHPGGHALGAAGTRPLPFFYDLYSFRGEGGTTTVVASFAVRVGRLDRERVDGEVRYRFNVSLVLADTVRGGVARSDDSVYVAVPRPLAREHLLHTHVETRAYPSSTTVHRVLMFDAPNPGTGQLYTRAFPIPDYGGDDLMLSDIALGLPLRGAGWSRGDATLALLPSSHFPGGLFDVYYEVYNLPEGNRYATEIAFASVDDAASDPAPLRIRFSGEAAPDDDGAVRELRRVEAPLVPGRYRLTVTVLDRETGYTARRSRPLEVRDWREGATLVPACPVAPGARVPGC